MMTDTDLHIAQAKLVHQQQAIVDRGHIDTLGEILGGDHEARSERITGKTALAWIAIFHERRRQGYQSGHFHGGVMLVELSEAKLMKAGSGALNEVDIYCRKYGLEADDLVAFTEVPIAVVVANRKRAGLPWPSIPVRKDGAAAQTLNVLMVNPDLHPR